LSVHYYPLIHLYSGYDETTDQTAKPFSIIGLVPLVTNVGSQRVRYRCFRPGARPRKHTLKKPPKNPKRFPPGTGKALGQR